MPLLSIVRCARHAGVAFILLALFSGHASAGPSGAPRDAKFESAQLYSFCRPLSSPVRSELAALYPLLSYEEFLDLIAMRTEASCERWIEEFWRYHDPILTTSENEARQEHERRVEFATSWFGRADWPGWDQRGEICIRYGLPTSRTSESADVTPNSYIRPVEYWFYPSLGMTVQFEDAFGNGNYTYYLEHVQLPSYRRFSSDRMRMPAGQWGAMPDLDLDYMTFDVTLGARGGYFGMYGPSDQFAGDDFARSLFRFPEVLETTPVVYPFDYRHMRVPIEYEVAYFRGGPAVDRVDVNAEFQVNLATTPGASETREYRTTTAIFDTQRNEVARFAHKSKVKTVVTDDESVGRMLVQIPFTLPPSIYELAITVEELDTGRFSSYRRTISPDDFDKHLAVSTLCFSSGIEPVRKESAFNRGALEVVPRPSARYDLATSVPVYFEVYNLTPDAEGNHRYQVSYRVLAQTPAPKGLWKKLVGSSDDDGAALASSFQSAATGPHDVVYIFLKTDQLWPGEFEFDVTVVDEVSKSETNRRGRFRLVD